jgi:hypothetical protein
MTDFVRSANAHPDHDDGLSLVVRPFVAREAMTYIDAWKPIASRIHAIKEP